MLFFFSLTSSFPQMKKNLSSVIVSACPFNIFNRYGISLYDIKGSISIYISEAVKNSFKTFSLFSYSILIGHYTVHILEISLLFSLGFLQNSVSYKLVFILCIYLKKYFKTSSLLGCCPENIRTDCKNYLLNQFTVVFHCKSDSPSPSMIAFCFCSFSL